MAHFYDEQARLHREVPLIDAERLRPGAQRRGPALIVAADTTVVLPDDARLGVRDDGCLVIDLDSAS